MTDPAVVRDVPAEERYAAEVDGRRAGFTQYRLRDGVISFLDREYVGLVPEARRPRCGL